MAGQEQSTKPKPELADFDLEAAELAFSVIARYVDHAQIAGLVVAQLASRLGEEGVKPIAQGEYWQAYMSSRRLLNEVKEDIERLTRLIERQQQERAAQPD